MYLFDAASILKICNQNIHEGIKFLSIKSDYYDTDDLNLMNKIYNIF